VLETIGEDGDMHLCHRGFDLVELLVRHVLEVCADNLGAITWVELLDGDCAKGCGLGEEAWHLQDGFSVG
jgi:hypothetical protein